MWLTYITSQDIFAMAVYVRENPKEKAFSFCHITTTQSHTGSDVDTICTVDAGH